MQSAPIRLSLTCKLGTLYASAVSVYFERCCTPQSLPCPPQFLERVKTRLRSREAYGDFLKCLNLYAQDIISRHELVQLVADIFGRAPELMVGVRTTCSVEGG